MEPPVSSPHAAAPDNLEAALGYEFRDRGLLGQALTHSSRKNDHACSNERLEFLGDAVLGMVVSDRLYRAFPEFTEGDLTRVKSAVVSRTTLARVAKGLGLGKHLIVAKGVARPVAAESGPCDAAMTVRRLPPSLLSDAFEAIIGAIYLDGGLDAAGGFIERHLQAEIQRACSSRARDAKSLLQDFAQRSLGHTPVYRLVAAEGPDHVKSFEVVTMIGRKRYGRGRGTTKKAAEQEAAARTLAMLGADERAAASSADERPDPPGPA